MHESGATVELPRLRLDWQVPSRVFFCLCVPHSSPLWASVASFGFDRRTAVFLILLSLLLCVQMQARGHSVRVFPHPGSTARGRKGASCQFASIWADPDFPFLFTLSWIGRLGDEAGSHAVLTADVVSFATGSRAPSCLKKGERRRQGTFLGILILVDAVSSA